MSHPSPSPPVLRPPPYTLRPDTPAKAQALDFLQRLVADPLGDQAAAYNAAFPPGKPAKAARAAAKRLLKTAEVREAYEYFMGQQLSAARHRLNYTAEWVKGRLMRDYWAAKKAGQGGLAFKHLETIAKSLRMLAAEPPPPVASELPTLIIIHPPQPAPPPLVMDMDEDRPTTVRVLANNSPTQGFPV